MATSICSTEGKRRRLSGKKVEMAGGGGKQEDGGARVAGSTGSE